MYISTVRIVNFRYFSEFEVNLNKGLSIIIEENKIGKSNFLEALNLIFNSNYSLRRRMLEQEDFCNSLVIQGTWPEIVIEATIKDIDNDCNRCLCIAIRKVDSIKSVKQEESGLNDSDSFSFLVFPKCLRTPRACQGEHLTAPRNSENG